jgi:hypothetical protein
MNNHIWKALGLASFLCFSSVFLVLFAPLALMAAPSLSKDSCSQQTAACEEKCATKSGMDRLSCKTDCRLAESKCRNSQH